MAHNRRLQRQRRKNWQGGLLLLGVLIVVVGIGAGYWYVQQRTVKLNYETLCPADGPHALTIILVDRTDHLNTVQREAVRVRLAEVRAHTAQYGALALFSIAPTDQELLRPEVYLCNPGAVGEASALYQNLRRVEQRWQLFNQRLEQAIDAAVQANEQPLSPIMESIQSAALSNFARAKPQIPKRLIVVSDLLQHSPALSLYQRLPRFDDFKTTESFRQLRTPLTDVEVEILYLRRPTARSIQSKALIEFWQQYLRDNGGVLARVVSIEG